MYYRSLLISLIVSFVVPHFCFFVLPHHYNHFSYRSYHYFLNSSSLVFFAHSMYSSCNPFSMMKSKANANSSPHSLILNCSTLSFGIITTSFFVTVMVLNIGLGIHSSRIAMMVLVVAECFCLVVKINVSL